MKHLTQQLCDDQIGQVEDIFSATSPKCDKARIAIQDVILVEFVKEPDSCTEHGIDHIYYLDTLDQVDHLKDLLRRSGWKVVSNTCSVENMSSEIRYVKGGTQ